MTPTEAEALVRTFWRRMAAPGFEGVAELLAGEAFVMEWPLSRERIRGAARFVGMNAAYPAHGPWRYQLHRLVVEAVPDGAESRRVVTDTGVTDGVQHARAISFFTVRGGRIERLVEFWPEPYEPPASRAQWVERMADVDDDRA
jgi:ketosteroid isomerase-like protein